MSLTAKQEKTAHIVLIHATMVWVILCQIELYGYGFETKSAAPTLYELFAHVLAYATAAAGIGTLMLASFLRRRKDPMS